MLRPRPRSHGSQSRVNARSPQVRPTDDDHPLLLDFSVNDSHQGRSRPTANLSASSQLDGLNGRRSFDARPDPHAKAQPCGPGSVSVRADTQREVYVHKVNKSDTLPKIILQYRIPGDILRRANRMYANDSIHFRDVLLLPVDACAIQPVVVEQTTTSMLSSPVATTSSSVSAPSMERSISAYLLSPPVPESSRPTLERRISPAKSFKSDRKSSGKELQPIRQVVIPGIGHVDISLVPASSLSYFPPPKISVEKKSNSTAHSIDLHESIERSSLEIIRHGAGKVAADAYNGTQGLIRRLKDKKHKSEIDLIEL